LFSAGSLLGELIVGGRKTVPQLAYIINKCFLIKKLFINQKGGQGDGNGNPSPANQPSSVRGEVHGLTNLIMWPPTPLGTHILVSENKRMLVVRPGDTILLSQVESG